MPAGVVTIGDARQLIGIADTSVDVVVTSPPYAGTYDYAEQHQLRLDFLGMSAEVFKQAEMGSRRHFARDGELRRRARRRWSRSLAAALSETARVLRPGGYAAWVLGDSIAGDRVLWADEAVIGALQKANTKTTEYNLRILAWAWQERRVFGAMERSAYGERCKRECIFVMIKDGAG